ARACKMASRSVSGVGSGPCMLPSSTWAENIVPMQYALHFQSIIAYPGAYRVLPMDLAPSCRDCVEPVLLASSQHAVRTLSAAVDRQGLCGPRAFVSRLCRARIASL